MIDWVSIANIALSRIGQDPIITSLDPADESTEAQMAAMFLPLVRDKIFTAHDWSFLRVRDHLAEVVNEKPHPPYKHLYMFPADAESIVFVFSEGLADYPQPFEIEANRDGARFICTPADNAWAEYQIYGDNVQSLPPLLEDAIAWGVAAELCGAIVKGATGAQLAQYALQMYELNISRAIARDAKQGRGYTNTNQWFSEFERSRLT